jgi:hypothetical protein
MWTMRGLSALNSITRISRRSQDSPLTVSRVRRETQWREPICELALFRQVSLLQSDQEWFRLGFFCSPGSWSSHQDGGPSCASSSPRCLDGFLLCSAGRATLWCRKSSGRNFRKTTPAQWSLTMATGPALPRTLSCDLSRSSRRPNMFPAYARPRAHENTLQPAPVLSEEVHRCSGLGQKRPPVLLSCL